MKLQDLTLEIQWIVFSNSKKRRNSHTMSEKVIRIRFNNYRQAKTLTKMSQYEVEHTVLMDIAMGKVFEVVAKQ